MVQGAQFDRWGTLALMDVSLRYRRTVIGPLWITLTLAATIGSVGTVYATLFKARQRLDRIVDRAGILALASHDIDLIKSICNRAILLEQGQIVAKGPVDDVLRRYLTSAGEAKAGG